MGFGLTRLQRVLCHFIVAALLGLAFVLACNYHIVSTSDHKLFNDIEQVPYNKVGLLLGTSKYSQEGGKNDHYWLRVKGAVQLFKHHKIDYILISGDNGTPYYDEPSTIRRDLLLQGIPSNRIYRDYAGFRTLDSIIRARDVFKLSRFTLISQETHNRRALYIAHKSGIEAIAFNAGKGVHANWENRVREVLARVLAFVEVNILKTKPKYLGPVIIIGTTPPT